MRTQLDSYSIKTKNKARKGRVGVDKTLYFMLIPGIILITIFNYGPLFGLAMAFQKYNIAQGILKSEFIGLENFVYLFTKYPNFWTIVQNTVEIASMKMVVNFIAPIVVTLLLNEVINLKFKRITQTLIYLPHFVSWVIISGILITTLSPTNGIINTIIAYFGLDPIYFLGRNDTFRSVLISSEVWKTFGWGTIIYMAGLTGIDPALYEAATIDRANRFQKIWHITLPGLTPVIILNLILNMPNVLNAGFDQIFNLYNPMVYKSADVLDTFIYRLGILDAQYDLSTAVGLCKSVISAIILIASYKIAYKVSDYRIF